MTVLAPDGYHTLMCEQTHESFASVAAHDGVGSTGFDVGYVVVGSVLKVP